MNRTNYIWEGYQIAFERLASQFDFLQFCRVYIPSNTFWAGERQECSCMRRSSDMEMRDMNTTNLERIAKWVDLQGNVVCRACIAHFIAMCIIA